jgi:hypothetical protein
MLWIAGGEFWMGSDHAGMEDAPGNAGCRIGSRLAGQHGLRQPISIYRHHPNRQSRTSVTTFCQWCIWKRGGFELTRKAASA